MAKNSFINNLGEVQSPVWPATRSMLSYQPTHQEGSYTVFKVTAYPFVFTVYGSLVDEVEYPSAIRQNRHQSYLPLEECSQVPIVNASCGKGFWSSCT